MNSNLLAIILTFLLSCSNNNHADLKDYFFPVEDFSNKKVYYFTSDNEQLDNFYWELETSDENGKTVFHTVILNEQRDPTYEVIENVKSDGVHMKETRIPSNLPNEPDLVSKVSKPETFLWTWYQNQKIACQYSTTFQSNGETMKQVVYRQKEFLGHLDPIKLFDRMRPIIKFRDSINQKVINVQSGEIIRETNFKQNSYWAEGIGLYRYERPKGNLTLTEIIDFED